MSGDRGADRDRDGRRIVLLRHAKSSRDSPGLTDVERPLTDRGRRDAAEAGRWLAEHVGRPDLVLCSTAVRTRQTWEGLSAAAPELLGDVAVRFEPTIYQAWPGTLLDLLRDLPDDVGTVVIVGHAPGVPDLAERLNRVTGDAPVGDFPTCALALLAVTGSWAALGPGTATLTAYAVPRG